MVWNKGVKNGQVAIHGHCRERPVSERSNEVCCEYPVSAPHRTLFVSRLRRSDTLQSKGEIFSPAETALREGAVNRGGNTLNSSSAVTGRGFIIFWRIYKNADL